MEEIINKLIKYHIKGVDTYTHNDSTWLIFTKTKQWVIELTDGKTLWYNYNFFKTIFSYASLEVVQNQHLITKWVEDNIMNKLNFTISNPHEIDKWIDEVIDNGVKNIMPGNQNHFGLEDTVQNGVKETKISPTYTEYGDWLDGDDRLDDIIKDGIKETQFNTYENKSWVEGVIKGGAKQTLPEVGRYINDVEEVIQDGVKKTLSGLHIPGAEMDVNHIIENGVKSSHPLQYKSEEIIDEVVNDGIKETHDDVYHHKGRIGGVIKNGVKKVKPRQLMMYEKKTINNVIKNGVKETKTPGWDGDIISTVQWLNENNATSYPKMIDDIIDNGEKINGTYAGGQRQSEKCESVVEYGTKNPTG